MVPAIDWISKVIKALYWQKWQWAGWGLIGPQGRRGHLGTGTPPLYSSTASGDVKKITDNDGRKKDDMRKSAEPTWASLSAIKKNQKTEHLLHFQIHL